MLSYHLSSKSVYGGPCKSKTNLCGSIILKIPVQCLEISFKMFLSLVMFRSCLVTLWANVRYAWDCLQVLHAFPSLHLICTHECWIWAWELLYKVNKTKFRLGLLNRIHVKSSKLSQNHIRMSWCPESFSTFNDLIHLSEIPSHLPAIFIPLHLSEKNDHKPQWHCRNLTWNLWTWSSPLKHIW